MYTYEVYVKECLCVLVIIVLLAITFLYTNLLHINRNYLMSECFDSNEKCYIGAIFKNKTTSYK